MGNCATGNAIGQLVSFCLTMFQIRYNSAISSLIAYQILAYGRLLRSQHCSWVEQLLADTLQGYTAT
jgi:hypothetical protein